MESTSVEWLVQGTTRRSCLFALVSTTPWVAVDCVWCRDLVYWCNAYTAMLWQLCIDCLTCHWATEAAGHGEDATWWQGPRELTYMYRLLRSGLYPLAPSPPVSPPFHSIYLYTCVHNAYFTAIIIYKKYIKYKILYCSICHKMIVVLYQFDMVMYLVVTPVCPDQVSMLSQIALLISQQNTLVGHITLVW